MFNRDKQRVTFAFRLFNRAFGRYKPQILLLTGLGFFSGILEGIGVNALIPLFSFLTETAEPTDKISRFIAWGFAAVHLKFSVATLLAFIAGLFLLKAFITHGINLVTARITANYERKTREQLFADTLEASWPYLGAQKIGYLEKVLVTDIGNGAGMLMTVSNGILTLTSLLVYAGVAFNISTPITLFTFVFGLLGFLLTKPLMYKIRRNAQRYNDTSKTAAHFINENMLGIKAIKAASLEGRVTEKSRNVFNEIFRQRVEIYNLRSLSSVFLEPASLIFICGVFAFSFYFAKNAFDVAAFVVVVYLIKRIFDYFQKFIKSLSDVNEVTPSVKSLVEYQEAAERHREEKTRGQKSKIWSEIVFENVSFRYNERPAVFENLNFTVKKNQMVGFIGPSGAGKTTLFDLLLGLIKPNSGAIRLDAQNLAALDLKTWRNTIGYMPQNAFLLNDTIEKNISFYDPKISAQDVIAACKMANIHDFAMQLPQKLQTPVGERGVTLSEGQKQRVALARVLASKPKLLLLDEATSALDNESEVLIKKALDRLKGQITILVIAHRLSTVADVDHLIAIDQGRIIEQGNPKVLQKDKNSYFYKTYNFSAKNHAS